MATPTLQENNMVNETIIAGHFRSGEDAHRAINALLDEGFLPSQIGAAFHTAGETGSSASASDSGIGDDTMRQELGTTITAEGVDADTSMGGPSSDTMGVQPAGLATGTGSIILGAGKPGPISGSELAHTGLPSELESELSHDQPGIGVHQPAYRSAPVQTASPTTKNTSWTSKLKHLFQSEPGSASAGSQQDQNFGTGEGELNLSGPYGRPYSQTAFESSVSKAGVPAENSRHLSHRLSSGGAVVTVSAPGRAVEVEKIFEEHHGVVKFASDMFDDAPSLAYEPRVEVFGHLQHHYPSR